MDQYATVQELAKVLGPHANINSMGLAHSPAIGEWAIIESAALRARITKLERALQSASHVLTENLEYFEELYDVRDGDEGRQVANKEMSLGIETERELESIKRALAKAEG